MNIRLLFSLCCLLAITSFATVHKVNILPAGVVQFNIIPYAIAANADCDTIRLHRSPNQSAGISVTKSVSLVSLATGVNIINIVN